jgi:hypothetical protein
LVVGDAILLPAVVQMDKPNPKPNPKPKPKPQSVKFFEQWSNT